MGVIEGIRLLADKKDIHGTKVEVIKEGEGRETIVCGMLSGIKLERKGDCQPIALDPYRPGTCSGTRDAMNEVVCLPLLSCPCTG
jgi:hypothetical protein